MVAAALAAVLAGCSDQEIAAPALPESGPALSVTSIANGMPSTARERAALEAVARSVAPALGDPEMRRFVKSAMASSRVKENKLHFVTFLRDAGPTLYAASARAGGLDGAAMSRELASVRDLEFYMPVAKHRSAWRGGQEVLVAAVANENDVPVAFTTSGERRVLSREKSPEEPVLVLIRRETRFDVTASPTTGQLRCVSDASESLAAANARCNPRPANAIGSAPNTDGLYAVHFGISNLHEPWPAGDPELETHLIAARSPSPTSIRQLQCMGEHAVSGGSGFQPGNRDYRHQYDQNDHHWEGNLLLANAAQLDTAMATTGAYNILIYEDDYLSCQIRDDPDNLRDLLQAAGGAVAAGRAAWIANGWPAWGATGLLIVALYNLWTIAEALNDDDFVGVLVPKDQTQWANDYPGVTHIVLDGSSFGGNATLQMRTTSSAGPVASVFVDPWVAGWIPTGGTKAFGAAGYDANGARVNTGVTWWSSNPSVASVASDGTVTGNGHGGATIYASIGGVQESRSISVVQAGVITSVVVSPGYQEVSIWGGTQLSATAYDFYGTPVSTTFSWDSSNPSSATVDQNGWVWTTGTEGYAQITAYAGSAQGTASIEVRDFNNPCYPQWCSVTSAKPTAPRPALPPGGRRRP